MGMLVESLVIKSAMTLAIAGPIKIPWRPAPVAIYTPSVSGTLPRTSRPSEDTGRRQAVCCASRASVTEGIILSKDAIILSLPAEVGVSSNPASSSVVPAQRSQSGLDVA